MGGLAWEDPLEEGRPEHLEQSKERTRVVERMLCSLVLSLYAAKALQSCPTLCEPTDGSPPGSPVPGTLQALEKTPVLGGIGGRRRRG